MPTPNIDAAAAAPAEMQTQGGHAKQHDLADQIAYDRYKQQNAARGLAGCGLIFSKLLPAAGAPDQQGTGANGNANFDQVN